MGRVEAQRLCAVVLMVLSILYGLVWSLAGDSYTGAIASIMLGVWGVLFATVDLTNWNDGAGGDGGE